MTTRRMHARTPTCVARVSLCMRWERCCSARRSFCRIWRDPWRDLRHPESWEEAPERRPLPCASCPRVPGAPHKRVGLELRRCLESGHVPLQFVQNFRGAFLFLAGIFVFRERLVTRRECAICVGFPSSRGAPLRASAHVFSGSGPRAYEVPPPPRLRSRLRGRGPLPQHTRWAPQGAGSAAQGTSEEAGAHPPCAQPCGRPPSLRSDGKRRGSKTSGSEVGFQARACREPDGRIPG